MSEVVAAPAPVEAVQAPTPQPSIFRNEGRDVLGDALRNPSTQAISGDTGTHFEPVSEETQVAQETPVEVPAPVVPDPSKAPETVTPVTPVTPVTERLYAGKFKTPEDAEKAYLELEKAFHKKTEEAAAAKKLAETKTPIEISQAEIERKAQLVNSFLEDPDKVIQEVQSRAVQQAQQAVAVQTQVENWRKANSDIAQYEFYVGAEVQRLSASDPNLAKDQAALLAQATTNFRQAYATIREGGKKEALSVQSSVTPLGNVKVQVAPPTEQPAKAPMSQETAVQTHMQFLKEQAARVRRPSR